MSQHRPAENISRRLSVPCVKHKARPWSGVKHLGRNLAGQQVADDFQAGTHAEADAIAFEVADRVQGSCF